jgi:hypothetical protein
MPRGSQKAIARVNGKVSASIYRGRFQMAEHMRYLDMKALARVRKAAIEVGSIQAAGVSVPLVAEVQKGIIVKLRPLQCTSCKPHERNSLTRTERQKAANAALQTVRDKGLHSTRLPMPMARLRDSGLGITITVTVDWEVCIVIDFGDRICYFCSKTPSFCLRRDPKTGVWTSRSAS